MVNNIFEKMRVESINLEYNKVYKSGNYEECIPIREDLEAFFSLHNDELYDLLESERWWEY